MVLIQAAILLEHEDWLEFKKKYNRTASEKIREFIVQDLDGAEQ